MKANKLKESKKIIKKLNKKRLLIPAIIFLIIGIITGFILFKFLYFDQINCSLNGDNVVITSDFDSYQDAGINAKFNNKDLKDQFVITKEISKDQKVMIIKYEYQLFAFTIVTLERLVIRG